MVRGFVLAALALGGCSGGLETSFSQTQQITPGREIYAAAADPTLPDAKLAADAKSLCKVGADWCMVVVVPNGTALPTGFPLSDVEAPSALGFYTLNRATGTDEFKRQTTSPGPAQ
jgi:hypothetical protein